VVPEPSRAPTAAGLALPARLDGRALMVVRAVWLLVATGALGLAAVGLAMGLVEPEIIAPQAVLRLSATMGVSARVVILVGVVAPLVVVALVAGVVFWRRSDDPMALLFTATLVALYVGSSRGLLAFAADPVLRHSITVVAAVALIGLGVVLATFPDGRFVPRPAFWLAPMMLLWVVVLADGGRIVMRLPDLPADIVPWRVTATVTGVCVVVALGLVAQVHRYRHVSGAIERLQTKWVMAPLGLLFAIALVLAFIPVTFVGASDQWLGGVLAVTLCIGLVFPAMVANAVLRYRLYDIDRVISRTVSYGLVVTLLAAVYVAGVVGVGTLVTSGSGEGGNHLVVAASTLAVAALFRPARRRVQGLVDRRFNRSGYEARQVVAAFTEQLRDGVDLDEISAGLVTVSARALEPSQASVWLTPGRGRFP
jgi:hypothetical protein